MRVEAAQMRRRLAEARVARLATVAPDGAPHLVPCCFALAADTVYSVIDAKPKASPQVRRIANLRENAVASLIVDHYDEDWSTLWWVRVDGRGRVLDDGPERDRAVELLTAKYEQYRTVATPGPAVALDITTWRGWAAG